MGTFSILIHLICILIVIVVFSLTWIYVVRYVKSLKSQNTKEKLRRLENIQTAIDSEYLGHVVVTAPKNSIVDDLPFIEGSAVDTSSAVCILKSGDILCSPIDGRIKKIFVNMGDTVRQGDALFSVIYVNNKIKTEQ